MSKQSPKRSGLAVAVSPDHHKGRLGEALVLSQVLLRPDLIRCQCMFGDDAFKFLLSAGFEQGMAVAIKLIAKLNTALVIGSNQMLQAVLDALTGFVAESPCHRGGADQTHRG